MAEAPQCEDDTMTPGYKPPAQKSLAEIQKADAEDESLRRYKEKLLGNIDSLPVSDDPRNVVVTALVLVVEGREDVKLDLTGDVDKLKHQPISLKEGTQFKFKVLFKINHDIVAGLRFITSIHKGPAKVDNFNYMLGSYGPKASEQEFVSPTEDAPKGMIGRGKFKAKSSFRDDDKNIYLKWEWVLEIHKDWHDDKKQ